MTRNYITYFVLRACLSHKRLPVKDIYLQLAETIDQRKKILAEYENTFGPGRKNSKNDIHHQLAQTLAERKRILERLHRVLSAQKSHHLTLSNQKAA